jgi:glycosyltransferase involved in cell wall biosynthesis
LRKVLHYAAAPVEGGLMGHLTLLSTRTSRHGYLSEVWIQPSTALDGAAAAMAAGGAAVRRLTVRGKSDLPGLLAFSRALLASDPDILHVHLASPVESLPVLFLARHLSRARTVTTEHAPAHHPAERPWSRRAKAAACRGLARVIALTDSDADYLTSQLGVARGKIRCVPNGVAVEEGLPAREEARRRLEIPPGAAVIAYVGEIVEKKGVFDLLAAMRGLDPAGGDSLAVLAGEGPGSLELAARAESEGLAGRFKLIGSLRPPRDLYAACDIFVLPSHGEASPLALLEAMAAGRPVVATQVGGIPDAVRDGVEGRLVPPGEPASLAAALADLLGDRARRETMGAAARARILAAFDVEVMVKRICALYDEILAGGSA